ncbi:recombinase family protein [Mucilaginibacter sp.]|uniref:recombinase family protein n=1 Tax=Mucilaginibacter sp. TaxID=1882438 RepID=UPI00326719A3
MKKAILYIRVSTDEQADKGYSQRSQDEVLHKYCVLRSIAVHDVVYEDHSAKTFNRPAWSKMLNGLKKSKTKEPVDFILFTKWDRFSRNTADAYQMIALLRKLGAEPQAIEQPLDLSVPENKMMLAFYLAVPEVENDRRALNIFHGIRRARKEGRWTTIAPVGYINRTTEEGRKYIRPHEPQAGIMKRAFAELATGRTVVEQVWKKAKKEGLSCGRNNFWNMVRNPVYCGKIVVHPFQDETRQLVEGQHEAIISDELFNQVQHILDGRKRTKGTKLISPEMLPLRGFITCTVCGRLLTGSASKGRRFRYYYYHCTAACRIRFKADQVNVDFTELLKSFIPKRPFRTLFKEIAKDVFKQQTANRQNQRLQTIAKLESQQARLKKARDLLLNDGINLQDYQEIKMECDHQIASLNNMLNGLADMGEAITQLLNHRGNKFLDLFDAYEHATIEDQRKLINRLHPNPMPYTGQGFNTIPMINIISLIYQTKNTR